MPEDLALEEEADMHADIYVMTYTKILIRKLFQLN